MANATDDHVVTLDEDTPDYYGSDVSSVSDTPDGFNDISNEEPWEETDTSSSTDGLPDGYLDRAADDHIGPDPDAIMQSVGDGGGGDASPDGALTDVHGNEAAYEGGDGSNEGSSTADEGSSTASDADGGPQAPATGPGAGVGATADAVGAQYDPSQYNADEVAAHLRELDTDTPEGQAEYDRIVAAEQAGQDRSTAIPS